MEKNKIFNIIIIIISVVVIISLIIFIVEFMSEFNFESFMRKLSDKLYTLGEFDYEYFNAFEHLFNRYYDSTYLSVLLNVLISISVIVPIFILLLTTLLLQNDCCCKQKEFLRFILSIIFLVFSLGASSVFTYYSFKAKYKIELNEDEIYRFDSEFNEEIKDNLNFMYNRKIYMFIFNFLSQICLILLTILIIVKYQINRKNNIEKNIFEKDIGVAPLNSK